MLPDCKGVTMLIIKEQETSLKLSERVKMYFHVYVVCKFCNLFYKQSNLLHQHIKKLSLHEHADKLDYHLSDHKKKQLQDLLDKETRL